ncbi:MAG: hypothetical protein ABI165_19715 [Bryobacteraceae bacterium]
MNFAMFRGAVRKTLPILSLSLLFSLTASADPIFRISFSGLMTQGASGLFLQADDTFAHVDLTGAKVSGYLDYDLALAPVPTVLGTTIRADSQSNPQWVNGAVTISGYSLPSQALPVPQQFAIGENPAPPGAMLHGAPSINQSLVYARTPNNGSEAILSLATFVDAWATDQQFDSTLRSVGLDLVSFSEFDSSPNGFPVPFVLTNSDPNNTSLLMLDGLFQDPRNAANLPLHGVTAQYQINGRFTNESVQGAFVTPEPATTGIVGFLLLIGAVAGRRGIQKLSGTKDRRSGSIKA